jgi:Holliday junction resolvase RusA-like endonuclease
VIERTYTILLEPRGKGRPVFTRATGSARTPETTRAWEHEAAHQLREQHQDVPCDETSPLWEVDIRAYHPRPKTRPSYIERALWGLPEYRLPATSRHDLDNVIKITLDAMQIARVVLNDRCIVSITAASWFVWGNEPPRVEVTMREVHP